MRGTPMTIQYNDGFAALERGETIRSVVVF
jgi:hypothetical protein